MSDPGMMMTPADYMQMQDIKKRQAMAAQLMGGNATGANGGITNAGNSILGAVLGSQARDQQNAMMQKFGVPPAKSGGWFSNIFNMGGGS